MVIVMKRESAEPQIEKVIQRLVSQGFDVHHDPDNALCDGAQSLSLDQFDTLMGELRLIAQAVGRVIEPARQPVGR